MAKDQSHRRVEDDIGTLSDLATDALRAKWRASFGIEPVAWVSRDLLVRAFAYRLQEQAQGGLSKWAKQQLAKCAADLDRTGALAMPLPGSRKLKTGTKLIREWQGRTHHVEVLEVGFCWNGEQFGSLSQIARAITGTRWSGPRFFGLDSARCNSSARVNGPGDRYE